jgi:hypothetical protein
MLAQDPMTGYLHEIPDAALYGYGGYGYGEYPDVVGEPPYGYDGLGYPVGLPFLAPLVAKAAGALAPLAAKILPGASQLASRLLPGLMPGGGGAPAPGLPSMPGLPSPFPPGFPGALPSAGMMGPRPFFRAPSPVGWVTPALPFTGTKPRRLYMRCAVWPGPNGMVPGFATQPLPTVPAVPVPGVAVPAMALRRRRRRR